MMGYFYFVAVLASIFIARGVQPSQSLVNNEVEFCELTKLFSCFWLSIARYERSLVGHDSVRKAWSCFQRCKYSYIGRGFLRTCVSVVLSTGRISKIGTAGFQQQEQERRCSHPVLSCPILSYPVMRLGRAALPLCLCLCLCLCVAYWEASNQKKCSGDLWTPPLLLLLCLFCFFLSLSLSLSLSLISGTCTKAMKCSTPRSSQEAELRTGRSGQGSASPPGEGASAAAAVGASTSPPGQRRGTWTVAGAFLPTAAEGWAAGEGPTRTRCVVEEYPWAWCGGPIEFINEVLHLELLVRLASAWYPLCFRGPGHPRQFGGTWGVQTTVDIAVVLFWRESAITNRSRRLLSSKGSFVSRRPPYGLSLTRLSRGVKKRREDPTAAAAET